MVIEGSHHEIKECRLCGSTDWSEIVDLGDQALTGRFPGPGEPEPPTAPLCLIRCTSCNLVQLRHSVDTNEMFGPNYGYRSGINATMTAHLAEIAADVEMLAKPVSGDIVLDIGCNDGTLLRSYSADGVKRVGIDPIADKFRDRYPGDFEVHTDFFTANSFTSRYPGRKASIVTSIAMFYDLESPGQFVADVASVLASDGVWVLEQSYLPTMLRHNSFDTICHEHLEYYALAQIDRLTTENDLRVFDVRLNSINGGSFQIWVCHRDAGFETNTETIAALKADEATLKLDTEAPYAAFTKRVASIQTELTEFIRREVAAGKHIFVYGASTKGNVLLQHFGLDHTLITACADRNPEKWGHRTPGTSIPIVSEEDARGQADYFLVLPWHFRDEFIRREADFRAKGGRLIFPLPEFEIV